MMLEHQLAVMFIPCQHPVGVTTSDITSAGKWSDTVLGLTQLYGRVQYWLQVMVAHNQKVIPMAIVRMYIPTRNAPSSNHIPSFGRDPKTGYTVVNVSHHKTIAIPVTLIKQFVLMSPLGLGAQKRFLAIPYKLDTNLL